MFIDAPVAQTSFLMTVTSDRYGRRAPLYQERVVGLDMSTAGLLLPEPTFVRVEAASALATLAELATLPDNWDGEGAFPVDPLTISNAKAAVAILLRIAPAGDIAPNPNGTISFEWLSERGSAHLEVGKTRFSFFVKASGGVATVIEGNAASVPADIGVMVSAVVYPQVRSLTAITKLTFTAEHDRAAA